MKIKMTVNVDDRTRRAIAFHYGKKGSASYQECKDHMLLAIDGGLDDVVAIYIEEMESKVVQP